MHVGALVERGDRVEAGRANGRFFRSGDQEIAGFMKIIVPNLGSPSPRRLGLIFPAQSRSVRVRAR